MQQIKKLLISLNLKKKKQLKQEIDFIPHCIVSAKEAKDNKLPKLYYFIY